MSKHTAPPSPSEIPARTEQDPERQAGPGHKGKGTTQVELAKIEAEREVELARIAAAEHETTGERVARILTALRPLAETCGKGAAGVLIAVALILAVYYGRSFDLSALGFTAKTGDQEPVKSQSEPQTPVPADAQPDVAPPIKSDAPAPEVP